jgi:hypothetical protein
LARRNASWTPKREPLAGDAATIARIIARSVSAASARSSVPSGFTRRGRATVRIGFREEERHREHREKYEAQRTARASLAVHLCVSV